MVQKHNNSLTWPQREGTTIISAGAEINATHSAWCCWYLCLRAPGFSELWEKWGKERGQEQLKANQVFNEATAAVFKPAGLHFIFTCFFLFIRCEVSGPVTDSRGLGPKPGAEVLQPCDGEMRLGNRGSCKSVRQDPRCVQLCPVKTLLPV